MSRLCRLKTNSHGEDGKWAYKEIITLRLKLAEKDQEIERLRDYQDWLNDHCSNGWDEVDALNRKLAAHELVIKQMREAFLYCFRLG